MEGIQARRVGAPEPNAQWQLAHEAHPEIELSARSLAAEFIGDAVLATLVEAPPETCSESHESTLQSSLQRAKQGDLQARESVATNVAQDVAERIFKAGHQTSVSIDITKKRRLSQAGLLLSDIYLNTLRYTDLNQEMYKRATGEVGNIFLFESLNQAGVLEDNYAVVFSLASQDQQTRSDYNFDEEKMTCSLQLLDVQNSSEANLHTALLAGRKHPDVPRHDYETMQKLATQFGASYELPDHADSVCHVFLVPKVYAPDGIDSIIELYDDAAGGTFYGEERPRQDYREYANECTNRNRSFKGIVEKITNELVEHADWIQTPLQAFNYLDKLSGQYCVEQAVADTTIDSRVFGSIAAAHIEAARRFAEEGDEKQAEAHKQQAIRTETSYSCPSKKGQEVDADDNSRNSESEKDEKQVKVTCPYCEAKVWIKPCAKRIICTDCTAEVVGGKVRSTGNGGTKRRTEEAANQIETQRRAAEEQMRRQVDEVYVEAGIEDAAAQSVGNNSNQKVLAAVQ